MLRGLDPARRGVRVPQQDANGRGGSGIGASPADRFAATFMQGLTVGALVEGLPIRNGHYAGGDFGWFSPFAALCGIGLCLGYALLGACWLVRKCEGEVRDAAWRQIPRLAIERARLPGRRLRLCAGRKSAAHGSVARAAVSLRLPGDRRRRGGRACRKRRCAAGMAGPSTRSRVIFMAAFGTLAVSFWPYMIPVRRSPSTRRRRRIPASPSCSGARASSSSR